MPTAATATPRCSSSLLGVGIRPTVCAATLKHGGLEYVLIETTSAVGVGFMAPDYNDARLEEFTVIP